MMSSEDKVMGSMPQGETIARQAAQEIGQSKATVVVRPSPAESLQPSLLRIREIARLPPNWDSAGAVPSSAEAVAQACVLIDAVAELQEQRTGARRTPLTSAPIADGGLQVEWMGGDTRIDVQIAPDGALGYLTKRGQGSMVEHEERDDVPLATLLDVIAQVLSR